MIEDRHIPFLVAGILSDATVWYEEPREWRTFDQFLGFQIGRVVARYQMTGEPVAKLLRAVYNQLDKQAREEEESRKALDKFDGLS